MKLVLVKNTLLKEKYMIEKKITITDISNIYLGIDKFTKKKYAIKELFLKGCFRDLDAKTVVNKNKVGFNNYKKLYLNEGKILNDISHKNIIKIKDVFEENNTVYIVTKYYEGISYDKYIQTRKTNIKKELKNNIFPILDAIEYLHKKKYLHRDIKPNNIMITKSGPVLLDFGTTKHIKYKNDIVNITYGFSPIEFYDKNRPHGNYSDIYSIAATIYYLKKKELPVSAEKRVINDSLHYNESKKITFLDKVIYKNMDLNYKKRAKNIKDMKKELKLAII